MEELIGFVAGNNKRMKILALLGRQGPQNPGNIARKTHIVENSVEKILGDLSEKKLVSKSGEKYNLTDDGLLVERRIRDMR